MNERDWQLLEDRIPIQSLLVAGVDVKVGDRIRLRPRQGGDVFDMALDGKIAAVESIDQDYEGRLHLAVVIEDDPGKDLGLLRQPGHRFFFDPDEVEPLSLAEVPQSENTRLPRILIAGIGNIFLGDDAFGVEVISRLLHRKFPDNVAIKDFGIKGFDLAYALMDGPDVTILIDACQRGGAPGTLYVIDPEVKSLEEDGSPTPVVETHGMNPENVLRLASSMGGCLKRILLIGCEPATFGPEEGLIGLSDPVRAAANQAVAFLESLVNRILAGDWSDFDARSVQKTGEHDVAGDAAKS